MHVGDSSGQVKAYSHRLRPPTILTATCCRVQAVVGTTLVCGVLAGALAAVASVPAAGCVIVFVTVCSTSREARTTKVNGGNPSQTFLTTYDIKFYSEFMLHKRGHMCVRLLFRLGDQVATARRFKPRNAKYFSSSQSDYTPTQRGAWYLPHHPSPILGGSATLQSGYPVRFRAARQQVMIGPYWGRQRRTARRSVHIAKELTC